MNKYLYIIIWFFLTPYTTFARDTSNMAKELDNLWLPWSGTSVDNIANKVWWDLISTFIQYVAIIAVIALMLSWLMYLIANWDEEKVKKAKNWILWSLTWVLLSISAWWIINIINNLKISN